MVRMIPASRSLRPPTKSRTSFVSGSSNRPLIVKSRRSTSSLGSLLKHNTIRMTAVAVSDVAAKGGNLNHVSLRRNVPSCISDRRLRHACSVPSGRGLRHQHNSELRTDRICFGKDAHDIIGGRVGRDVVVGGLAAEQQIAYTSSDEIRFVIALPQGADDRNGKVFEHGNSDAL